MTEQDDSSRTC